MADGIDVFTLYQDVRDWRAVRLGGVSFAYVKASDGDEDRDTGGYGPAGRAAGVAMGAYHYAQFGDPIAQADRLVGRATSAGLTDLAPALDLEDPFAPNQYAIDFAIAFLRRVRDRGHRPCLYANENMMRTVRAPAKAAVPETWVWCAKYSLNAPSVPYDLWQYSSAGQVPGISASSVDLSRGTVPLNHQPAPTIAREDEGVHKTFEPGDHMQAVMDIYGCKELRLLTGWGHNVTLHKLVFIADTDYARQPRPGDTGGTYDQGYDGPDWTFVPDRPGPYPIPQAPHPAVQLSFEYSADHAFDLSAH